MKKVEINTAVLAVGTAAGAILAALVILIVFGLRTGAAGAALILPIILISAFLGWISGVQRRIRGRNRAAYLRGYRKGMEKRMVNEGDSDEGKERDKG